MGSKLRKWIGLVGITLLVAACGGGGGAGSQTVEAKEFAFAPPTVAVRLNQPATIALRNTGGVAHDWTVQGLSPNVAGTAQPGQTTNIQFTPGQAGTYRVVCVQAGHEAAGMVGQLIVQ